MPLYDQIELLCQAILSQGRQEADKIVSQARDQAARQVAAEETRSREALQRGRDEMQAQARFEARNRLDRAALEGKRQVAEAKEAALTEIFQQGRERLQAFRQEPEYPEWLHRLLVKAARELGGDHLRIITHLEETRWLTPELLEQVGRESGCRLELETDPETPPGGFLAVRTDGRLRYDLTFQGIIDRRRESLRAALARLLWQS
jgi:vacuolar-type H+-ATPase subunit E/Vma4